MLDNRETPPPYEPTWAEIHGRDEAKVDAAWQDLLDQDRRQFYCDTLYALAVYVDLLTRAHGWDES